MRLIFAGTPEFARVALDCLHAAGFEIPLVLTQPDRPAGRGMKLQASSVKQWAESRHISVAQPRSLRLDGKYPEDAAAARAAIAAARADVMVVAAYGLILPQWVLDAMSEQFFDGPPLEKLAPAGGILRQAQDERGGAVKSVGARKLGCLNIHASLLPRWRGAAPIHRAIEAGDAETGVTIMQMDAGLDTGAMLRVQKLPITATDSTESLHDKLASLGGRLIVETLEAAAGGGLRPVPQPTQGISYAHKIDKAEAQIDWSQSALLIERRIRAFSPFPVAVSELGSEAVKFRQAICLPVPASSDALPGQVLAAGSEGVDICTGDGVLRALRLQKAGGKVLDAADFLHGFEILPGARFGHTPSPLSV